MEKKKESNKVLSYLMLVTIFLVLINILLSFYALSFKEESAESLISIEGNDNGYFSGNTAVIPIKGDIAVDETGYFSETFFATPVSTSEEVVMMIEKADKNPSIKAIVLDINSLGGSPVASQEMSSAIKKTNKTMVAWIREYGLSAAYNIASATDWIVASPSSNVGSIGVIIQYEILNVSHVTVKSAKYKDIYSFYRPLTDEEKQIAQEEVDINHKSFIDSVAENRRMDRKKVEKLADGREYLGIRAKELGLVDNLGGKDEVLNYIKFKSSIEPIFVYYNKQSGNFDLEFPEEYASTENEVDEES